MFIVTRLLCTDVVTLQVWNLIVFLTLPRKDTAKCLYTQIKCVFWRVNRTKQLLVDTEKEVV